MTILTRIKSLFSGWGNRDNEYGIPASYPTNWWQRDLPTGQAADVSIVHACADAVSQTLALLPPEHYRKKPDGGKKIMDRSALSQVIRNPNSYQTRTDLIYYLIKTLMLYGNAYALAIRNDRMDIVELHPIHSRSAMPYVEPDSRTVFYGIGNNPLIPDGLAAMIPQRDVLHLKLYTPRHPLIGVSPVTHCVMSIGANAAITRNQATFFNNMSRPSGVLSTDQVLTKDQMIQLREAWNNQSQGINTGNVPVLFGGLKFQPLAVASNDAQVMDAFSLTVEDVARAFRVPLPLIGDYRHQNYNNVERLISLWMSTGLGFITESVELAVEKFFELPVQQKFNFNTDAILRTDFKGRIDGLTKGISGGLFTPNEARRREGLPEVEFGDEPRLQAQVVPLSQVGMEPAAPAPSAPVPEVEHHDEPDADDKPGDDDDEKKMAAIYYVKQRLKGAA